MRKCLLIIALLLSVLFASVVTATNVEKRWELADDWYGFPVTASIEYDGVMCVITSDNYDYKPHFKLPSDMTGIANSRADKSGEDTQSWFLQDGQWELNENLGDTALSNIVGYKDDLYVSVEFDNETSCLMVYDGQDWDEMNGTQGMAITDMVVCGSILYAVGNDSNQISTYDGIMWHTPSWSNLSGIAGLGVYDGELLVSTEDNLYVLGNDNLSEYSRPSSKVVPVPMTIYQDDLYASFRNQIYAYNGHNWTLVKVIDPLYDVSVMYPIDDCLYIGAQANPYENETRMFIYDGSEFEEGVIAGSVVYTIEEYGGNIYAGTNLGLYTLHTYVKFDESRLTYALWASLILAVTFILYGLYSWDEGFEDAMTISLGLAFLTLLGMLFVMPSLILTYVVFIPVIAVFIAFTIVINYAYNMQWQFRYDYKDVRILAVVLVILLIIEICTQVFSKAVGL